MKIKPVAGKLLVKQIQKEKKTKGGIYLPDQKEEDQSQHAKVIAIGLYSKSHPEALPAPCEEGDMIIFKKWAGNEAQTGYGKKDHLLFIEFKDVMGVVEE